MLNYREVPVGFACQGESLVGILAQPEKSGELGVVIVVGGPQTRVGSHRQFVLLARGLAAAGIATLRFDHRGMGDSSGDGRTFESIEDDIRAAIDAFQTASPAVGKIALWGLCDAASAALLYVERTRDARVDRLCLLNPWVRTESGQAKTQVRHYYGQRLFQREFWLKLFTGRLDLSGSAIELTRKFRQSVSPTPRSQPHAFHERMARGLRTFDGPVLIVLSGEDFTAKEFLAHASTSPAWRGLLNRPGTTRIDVPGADHTFSSRDWRRIVENACIDWLKVHGNDIGSHVA